VREFDRYILEYPEFANKRLGISTSRRNHLSFSGSFCAIDLE